jgi:hypothetical protein
MRRHISGVNTTKEVGLLLTVRNGCIASCEGRPLRGATCAHVCAQLQLIPAHSSQGSDFSITLAGGGSCERFPKPLFLRLDLSSKLLFCDHAGPSVDLLI